MDALPTSQQTYAIIGAGQHVYNILGPGFLEAVYQEALEIEFQKRNIPYEKEKLLNVYYEGQTLKHYYKADFVCYGTVILELKAVSNLENHHRAQLYNYLRVTGTKVGLLFNFGNVVKLQYERKEIRNKYPYVRRRYFLKDSE